MKKFIVKTIVFLAIFVAITIAVVMVNRCFARFKIAESSEILIFGNSHPECAINDALIPGVVNFSESGETYLYTYIKVKQFLDANPQVEHILVEFSNLQIDEAMDEQTWGDIYVSARLPRFGSFMDWESIKLLGRNNPRSLISTLPLLSKDITKEIVVRRLDFSKNMGRYKRLDVCKVDSMLRHSEHRPKTEEELQALSRTNMEYLRKVIEYGEQKGVKVTLVRCPTHEKNTENQNEQVFQNILTSEYADMDFVDFARFPLETTDFADLGHLNYVGAEKFSRWLAALLSNGLLERTDKQNFVDSAIAKFIETQDPHRPEVD